MKNKIKDVKKVGIPKEVSTAWFDTLVSNSMMMPVVLRRITRLEKQIRKLSVGLDSSKGKEHVLIWRNVGGMGDILMQSAIARELKKQNPHSHIVYQVPEKYLSIPKHNPYVDEAQIVEVPFVKGAYDRTIKLSNPCPASVYELVKKDITKSRTDLFLEASGIKKAEDKSLCYQVRIEEKKWAAEFLKGNKAENKIKIGFELRSIEDRRDWVRWKELADLIYRDIKDVQIFIFDHDIPMAWKDKRVINVCGYPLEDVAAIIETLDLIIGPDSGLLHLAGALQTPILGLFGAIPPFLRLNDYSNADWIWHQPHKECPCWYSFPCGDSTCMKMVTPQEVLKKAKGILVKKPKRYSRVDYTGKTILIERIDKGLGDILTITVGIKELKRQFPSCYVIFKVPAHYKPLLENNPYIDEIIDLEEEAEKDIFVSYSRLCPAGVYEHHHNRNIFKSRVDIFCDHLGFKPKDKTPVFCLTDKEIKQGAKFLKKAAKKKKVGIALSAAEIWVSWTREGNLSLIKLLIKKGYVPVVFTMKNQSPVKIKGAINVHGQSIRKMAAIYKNCDIAVTQDGGMLHMAAALGVPQVCLLGPTDPKYRVSMYKDAHWIVKHKKICPLKYDDHNFCWYYSECTVDKQYPQGNTEIIPPCLKAIKAEDVLKKIEIIGIKKEEKKYE